MRVRRLPPFPKTRAFTRRRLPWRKIKPNRKYLEEHEERIILRDLILLTDGREGVRLGKVDLLRAFPERYNERYLGGALKRMAKKRLIRRGGRMAFGGVTYWVDADTKVAA